MKSKVEGCTSIANNYFHVSGNHIVAIVLRLYVTHLLTL